MCFGVLLLALWILNEPKEKLRGAMGLLKPSSMAEFLTTMDTKEEAVEEVIKENDAKGVDTKMEEL